MSYKTEKLFADAHGIDKAIALIRAGELVAIPTETVYGLAANALDARAAASIFAAKERPAFDPLIVHVPRAWQSSAALIDEGILSDQAMGPRQQQVIDSLINAFWPGPLTIVAPKSTRIPDVVTSGLPTVGVRMPDHPVTQVLLQRLALPLAAPSANRFGRISPTSADHVLDELDGRIPAVLDGGRCEVGVESTIVSVERDGSLTVLRPGGTSVEALREALAFELKASPDLVRIHDSRTKAANDAQLAMPAPGMLESHYAPAKGLLLMPPGTSAGLTRKDDANISSFREKVRAQCPDFTKVGYLVPSGNPQLHQKALESALGVPVRVESLSPKGDLVEAARNLFAAMRSLDSDTSLSCLVGEPCADDTGIAFAINDRLRRASAGK
ncbi:threonylcarbamoyl-AMP synthase [bacterium]|nr:threonylcarbamoyl-AMP synthase [bacterium]